MSHGSNTSQAKNKFIYTGTIRRINYYPELPTPNFETYNLSNLESVDPFKKAGFKVSRKSDEIIVSWWVSPKRTRSYPYARVYDTLSFKGKKVTIIPFVKDEGQAGDRDFIQWDSISFMSLLGVYVIIGYYVKALPKSDKLKITCQRHDPKYIKDRLEQVFDTTLPPQDWNVKEAQVQLMAVAQKSKEAYEKISRDTGIALHRPEKSDDRSEEYNTIAEKQKNFSNEYRDYSRIKSKEAQKRESITINPKENLTVARKGVITLEDYLGGYYSWTTDEIIELGKHTFLIEKKHSSTDSLPKIGDVKDGFVKLMVYSNIINMKNRDNGKVNPFPCLGLTSNISKGACWNYCKSYDTVGLQSGEVYLGKSLKLPDSRKETLKLIFDEGKKNNILVYFLGNDSFGLEEKILELSHFISH